LAILSYVNEPSLLMSFRWFVIRFWFWWRDQCLHFWLLEGKKKKKSWNKIN